MATVDDLFHVVFNLTENAVKYNVPGGSVLLKTRGADDKVRLRVSDTGIGIPEEDRRLNVFARLPRGQGPRPRGGRQRPGAPVSYTTQYSP